MARNRQLTEKRILEAAQEILRRDGFEAWGINAIAREAGVDKVLLYRYYQSLDGLLDAVIEATGFWPDPDGLAAHSPEAFIGATLSFLEQQSLSRLILAHPSAQAPLSRIRRRFSEDLNRWLEGFNRHTRGSIAADQLHRLPALMHFQAASGQLNSTPHDLWQQVSPPLEWAAQRDQWAANEELPTELL